MISASLPLPSYFIIALARGGSGHGGAGIRGGTGGRGAMFAVDITSSRKCFVVIFAVNIC
jgi:hypothetical protein